MNLPQTLPERLGVLLDRLTLAARALGRQEVKRKQGDSYIACCPGHDDKNPSLSIKLEPHKILLNCFAGCELDDIITAIGFPAEALFSDYKQLDSRPWPTLGRRVNGQTYEHEHASLALPAPECEARIPLPPSLTAFQGLTYPPINPILGPWASQQINLVFAPSGAGKTMFGLSLAYAMAEGQDFLGWEFHGEPRTVLYIDGEMAARMMQERFGSLTSDRLHIANVPGWWVDQGGDAINLASEAGQDVLNVWVEALGADVIILDNFMSLAWRDGVSYSSDEIWTPFKRWCTAERARDKCVIMVDHANIKGGVFGTKTKLNVMDLVAEMEPLGDEMPVDDLTIQGSWVRFKFTKTRGYSDSLEIVNSRDVQIGPVGSTWNTRDPGDALTEQIKALRKDSMSIRDIAAELNVSYSKVQRAWRRVQMGDSQ